MSALDQPRYRLLALLALWLLAALAALRLVLFAVDAAELSTNGFVAYHTAARLLRQGVPVARFYDDAWFETQVMSETPGVREVWYVNPPTAALPALPLAGVTYAAARAIWTGLGVVLLAVGALWLLRDARPPGWVAPVWLIALLTGQPLRANLHQGQAYIFLLALLIVAWYAYRRGRERLLGLSLGLALALKLAGPFLLPLLLAQRRWRALGWALGSALALVAGTLPWIGFSAWMEYGRVLLRLRSRPDLAVTAYQSLPGLIRHLTQPDGVWNPGAPLDAPLLGRVLQAAALLGLVALCYTLGARARAAGGAGGAAFAAAVTAGVIVSPVSADYHYLLLYLPLALLLAGAARRGALPEQVVLIAALLLIGLNVPHPVGQSHEGLSWLWAYPQLYAGLLILGCAGASPATLAPATMRRQRGVRGEARPDPARL